ncbi:hypothetical protein FHX37_1040 [Haloactinospora alba]|uniref:Uncharacterized protein n=1 Tax=Haloactinospora alba TaxID=405555 RepID=A0A543NH23_9ACTN|nr:hypothetical protein [Haloactinospora alba]TQN31148.1 hypothetical protein FHX37_1040 [Haloactinospora alba]
MATTGDAGFMNAVTADHESMVRFPEREADRVESEAPVGWRVVWLPRHGMYLAYTEAEAGTGAGPCVAEAEPDRVISSIRALGELRDGVRKWVAHCWRAEL